jgi:hypothetical protein
MARVASTRRGATPTDPATFVVPNTREGAALSSEMVQLLFAPPSTAARGEETTAFRSFESLDVWSRTRNWAVSESEPVSPEALERMSARALST